MSKRISDKVYSQILENMVIPAVDAIIYQNRKVLLALRNQEHCKGQWWIPGGRQEKGETGEEAIIRKVHQEIGLDVKVEKLVGVYDVFFDKTAFPNVKTGVHYLARAYLVTPTNPNQNIKLDKTQNEYKWIDRVEKGLDEKYIKKVLNDSGFF